MMILYLLSIILIQNGAAQGSGYPLINCTFARLGNTVIHSQYRSINDTVSSPLDCVLSYCNCTFRCAVSYNPISATCVQPLPNAYQPGVEISHITTVDADWMTLFNDVGAIEAVAFWRLSNSTRGRNLGSKGSLLDMDETGLYWDTIGPLGSSSNTRYPTLMTSNRAKVQLQHGGEYAVKFTEPFTIGVWVKTKINSAMPILDGVPNLVTFNFWFYPNSCKVLMVFRKNPVHAVLSVVNSNGWNEWRFIVAVHRGVNDYGFYLNGKEWPIDTVEGAPDISQPSGLEIGRRGTGFMLDGDMACLSIIQHALDIGDVTRLMHMCP